MFTWVSQTFAHPSPPHLRTDIILFHRVMVLDAGKIVEFDSPDNLLEKQGHFYSMAKDAGITKDENTAL